VSDAADPLSGSGYEVSGRACVHPVSDQTDEVSDREDGLCGQHTGHDLPDRGYPLSDRRDEVSAAEDSLRGSADAMSA